MWYRQHKEKHPDNACATLTCALLPKTAILELTSLILKIVVINKSRLGQIESLIQFIGLGLVFHSSIKMFICSSETMEKKS